MIWIDLTVALSAANLSFLLLWNRAFLRPEGNRLLAVYLPKYIEVYPSLILSVLLLAAAMFFLLRAARKVQHPFPLYLVHLSLFVLPLNSIRLLYYERELSTGILQSISQTYLVTGIAVLGAGFVYFTYSRHLKFMGWVKRTFVFLFPYCLVNFACCFWMMGTREFPGSASSAGNVGHAPVDSSAKVVLIIFDAMDYRATFLERPEGVQLPAFDKFRRESFSAENASSPADRTIFSISSFFQGSLNRDLGYITRKAQNSLFSTLKKGGHSSTMIGWYFPYCRVYGHDLAECHSLCGMGYCKVPFSQSVTRNIENFGKQVFSFIPPENGSIHLENHRELVEQSKRTLSKLESDFVAIHLPLPHDPWTFDYQKDRVSFDQSQLSGYFGNLTVADRTFAELRQSLEKNGKWENTTVIVTADHWWREAPRYYGTTNERVPFLIKMPGQKVGHSFSEPQNTVSLASMVTGLLDGKINSEEKLRQWFVKNTDSTPAIYGVNEAHDTVIH